MREDYAPNTIDVVADVKSDKVYMLCGWMKIDACILVFVVLVVSVVRLFISSLFVWLILVGCGNRR